MRFTFEAKLSALCAAMLVASGALAAPFTPGNVVVYRVGDGAAGLLNTGAAVFLDEFSPSGALVQSVPLPATAIGNNRQLIASGTSTSEGLLSRTADGQCLLAAGYARDLGGVGSLSSTAGAAVPRTVALIGASASIDTRTALADAADGNNPRGVAGLSCSGAFWFAGGAGGVRTFEIAATTSTQVSTTLTNVRQPAIFAGQLYISTGVGTAVRIGTVGSGLPTTSGQVIAALPGFSLLGSPYAYVLADLSDTTVGVDTLYVADDSATALSKYTLSGGNWALTGTVGADADDYRGLTASIIGTTVALFAVRNGGNSAPGGGQLVTLVDASGYNGTLTGMPSLLATAATNTAFRGVAFAPVALSDLIFANGFES